MSKFLIGVAAVAAGVFAASSAYAMGGGPTRPSASPYAILEPQTLNLDQLSFRAERGYPDLAPAAEGRAAFTAEDGHFRSDGEVSHKRFAHHSHHHAPAPVE